jgi:hypothetical protein
MARTGRPAPGEHDSKCERKIAMNLMDWFETFVLEDPATLWSIGFSALMGLILALAAKFSNEK